MNRQTAIARLEGALKRGVPVDQVMEAASVRGLSLDFDGADVQLDPGQIRAEMIHTSTRRPLAGRQTTTIRDGNLGIIATAAAAVMRARIAIEEVREPPKRLVVEAKPARKVRAKPPKYGTMPRLVGGGRWACPSPAYRNQLGWRSGW
ncbi:MAG: hypothetical protein ACLQPH_20310 [Acidimicrobiales bacterium]